MKSPRADLDAVADLLTRGFVGRSRDYWMQGLRRQAARKVPQGYPRFGYMLDNDGTPVGVLLLLYTFRDEGGEPSIYCNLSSWYVEPAFRNYATLLTKIAQRHKEVTYLNISPATWTWPIIEAQGFSSYCSGLFFSIPALSRAARGMTVETVAADTKAVEGLSDAEVELLTRHARYGCLSLVCRTAGGERVSVHPAADAHPPRLDRAAGDAADLLPRHRRVRRMRRRDRPRADSVAARFPSSSMPTGRSPVSPASSPRRAAANISRARTGRVLPT